MKRLLTILTFILLSITAQAQLKGLWVDVSDYIKVGDSTATVIGKDTLISVAHARSLIEFYFSNVAVDSALYADSSGHSSTSTKADSSIYSDTSQFAYQARIARALPTYLGPYDYNSNQFAPPSTGQFRLNTLNTTITNATTCWLHYTDQDGTDNSFAITQLLTDGDELFFEQVDNPSNAFLLYTSGLTDNSTYATVNIDSVDVIGTISYDVDYDVYIVPKRGGNEFIKVTADTLVANDALIVGTDTATSLVLPKENLITVAKDGGDFKTLEAALASITGSSTTNRYTIRIAPGVYNENNPLPGKDYVTIVAEGARTAVIEPDNINADLFQGGNFFRLIGLVFKDVTGAPYWAVNNNNAGTVEVINCVVRDCANGIYNSHTSGVLEAINVDFNTPVSPIGTAFGVTGGEMNINGSNIRPTAEITTLVDVSGASSRVNVHNIQSLSPNVTTGLHISDTSRIVGAFVNLAFLTDGIVFSGDSVNALFTNFNIVNVQNDGFRIDAGSVGAELSLFSTTIIGSGNLNFNILEDSCTVLGNGYTELDKGYIEPGANFFVYLLDTKLGDEGLSIFGELHVGSASVQSESAFGGGDSYSNHMLVYEYNGSLTTYENVTDSVLLEDGNRARFPTTGVNSAIYIASTVLDSSQHYGLKLNMDDSLTIGAGEIVAEYFDGSTWVEFNGMVTDSDAPFAPHAKAYFEQTQSTQLRYTVELSKDNWIANDPMGSGTARKWVRFRIASPITSSCAIDQIKLHPSRFEINRDGFTELFGDARNSQILNLGVGSGEPFEGNMQSQTIYVDENIGVGYQQNRFTATGDKLGYPVNFPDNLDTSSPINLVWSGRSVSSGAMQWTVRYVLVSPGQTLYTSEPAPTGNATTIVLDQTVTSGINELFTVTLDVSEALITRENGFGDQLWISVQPTTLSGNFDLTNIGAAYITWAEGGYR